MGPLALMTLTGVFVVLGSTELLDNRCFQGKNTTWPKDECNSVIIEGFFCREDKVCPYTVLMNTSLPENVTVDVFRVKLDDACDCSCNCNCNSSQQGLLSFTVQSSGNRISIHKDNLSSMMNSGCYQYYSSTHNISSCCILFPGYDYDEERYDLSNAVEPDHQEPAHKENNKNWYYWGGAIVGALLVVALSYSWKKGSFKPHLDIELSSSPSTDTPPSKPGKKERVVIIYADQCNPTTRKLIGKLIKGFQSALKNCTISDYKKIGSLLEQDIRWLYTGNTFDKVIVLLSPEVSSLQLCNTENIGQDFDSRFLFHFFTKYLLHPSSNDKIIYISFEQFPCLDLNFCSPSTVYALPTRLKDVLRLFDFKGDDSVIREIESDLRKENNRS